MVPTELTGPDVAVVVLAAALVAGGTVAALALAGRSLPDLYRGKDGRASTSIFLVVAWTLAIAWGLLALMLGELWPGTDSALASGWKDFSGAGDADSFQQSYFLLLGLPVFTAAGARAITGHKVGSGAIVKPPPEQDEGVRDQALSLIADDRGNISATDFQLVMFNLLLLVYFAGTLLTRPADGLPDLPATLLALAGISSAGYTTGKLNESTPRPLVSSVRPSRLTLGPTTSEIEVFGGPFVLTGTPTAFEEPDHPVGAGHLGVTLDGVTLLVTSSSRDRITAIVPARGSADGDSLPVGFASLVVYDENGAASEAVRVELLEAPAGAAVSSDERLAPSTMAELDAALAELAAEEADEEALVAGATPAHDEPGRDDPTAEVEPVLADPGEDL